MGMANEQKGERGGDAVPHGGHPMPTPRPSKQNFGRGVSKQEIGDERIARHRRTRAGSVSDGKGIVEMAKRWSVGNATRNRR
jgi:hypothetical protein